MKIIKYILLIITLCLVFNLFKPFKDFYCYYAGFVIGTISEFYWLEYVIKGDEK